MSGRFTTMTVASLPALLSPIFVAPRVMAGPVTVPNTFTAGTPAKAAEVNANFSAVEEAVNDNDSRLTATESALAANSNAISNNAAAIAANTSAMEGLGSIAVLDGHGQKIGLLANINDDNLYIDVLTDQNYILNDLSLGDGIPIGPHDQFFSTADCAGTAYTATPPGFVTLLADLTGNGALYYVDKGATATPDFPIESVFTTDGCQTISGTLPFAWMALPNDPAVTGVSDPPYQLPIKITASQ